MHAERVCVYAQVHAERDGVRKRGVGGGGGEATRRGTTIHSENERVERCVTSKELDKDVTF